MNFLIVLIALATCSLMPYWCVHAIRRRRVAPPTPLHRRSASFYEPIDVP